MRTRDVMRWNLSTGDTLAIIGVALTSLVLRALDVAAVRIEHWIDRIA